MTANPGSAPSPGSRPIREWSWVWLIVALTLVALIRVPLVLNAEAHLDSDLAVDGLTLIDALNGHWRWHYPATPFIGTPPVLVIFGVWAILSGLLQLIPLHTSLMLNFTHVPDASNEVDYSLHA